MSNGPTQNPYLGAPAAPPLGAPPGGYADPLAGAGGVGLEARSAPCPLGDHEAEIVSIRQHNGIAGPGILIDVEIAGKPCGWRIQLGGRYPQYGIRDAKILHAAVNGWATDDPRAIAADTPQLRHMMAEPCPFKGARIRVAVTQNVKPDRMTGQVKVDPQTGAPYLNVRPRALDGASAAPPVPAAAPIPASVSGPPPGWFDFPEGDPRRGVQRYNAAGQIASVTA